MSDNKKQRSRVVAAVIQRGSRFLCMKRSRGRYLYTSERWEFPGGKVDTGETDHEALLREIKEEMDWDIYVGRKLATIDYDYPDFGVQLTAYLCRVAGTKNDFKLLEHLDYRWLTPDRFDQLNWTDADKQLIKAVEWQM